MTIEGLVKAELARASAAYSDAQDVLLPFAHGGRLVSHLGGLLNFLRTRIERAAPNAKVREAAEAVRTYAGSLSDLLFFHDNDNDQAARIARAALAKMADAAARIEDEYRPKAA
jgi:hypothetical protein